MKKKKPTTNKQYLSHGTNLVVSVCCIAEIVWVCGSVTVASEEQRSGGGVRMRGETLKVTTGPLSTISSPLSTGVDLQEKPCTAIKIKGNGPGRSDSQ